MNLTTHPTEVHLGFPTFVSRRCFSRSEHLIFSESDILGLTFVSCLDNFSNAGNLEKTLHFRYFLDSVFDSDGNGANEGPGATGGLINFDVIQPVAPSQ